jgi:hypothetical protein
MGAEIMMPKKPISNNKTVRSEQTLGIKKILLAIEPTYKMILICTSFPV